MANYQLTQSGNQVQTLLDKIGTASLDTTATNLSDAVNELKDVTDAIGTCVKYVNTNGTIDADINATIRRIWSDLPTGISAVNVEETPNEGYALIAQKENSSYGNFLVLPFYDNTLGFIWKNYASGTISTHDDRTLTYTYTGSTDANGFITTDLVNDRYIPLCGRCDITDTNVEFTTGSSVWWMRVTKKGVAQASTAVSIKVWYKRVEY